MGQANPRQGREKALFKGQTPRGELSRYDSKTKQFQPFLGGISAQGPVFSNDGNSVAYGSYPEEILWKANADGSNPVQLTDPLMFVLLPRWSPDGTQIVFTGASPSGGSRIYIVSSEGGSPPKRLSEDSESLGENFAYWSPDGRKITFNVWTVENNSKSVIRILDLESHQVTTVPGSADMIAPRWSPDGRYLSSCTDGGLHLKIFDFKMQQWSEIAWILPSGPGMANTFTSGV